MSSRCANVLWDEIDTVWEVPTPAEVRGDCPRLLLAAVGPHSADILCRHGPHPQTTAPGDPPSAGRDGRMIVGM